ncbi:MAG: tetratricopeptide repeat protein [Verrucomicrobiota bacterium]|jgi:Flp pilus assembly protein TadD
MLGQESSPNARLEAGRPQSCRRKAVICLALAAITFAVFGRTLTHGFVDYDDGTYVFDNAMVFHGLTLRGLAWAFTSTHAANWHPLTWLSHMLDCQLYGLHPGGHHLTNVLLHTATVIALFLVLRQMTGALWRSAFVAAVFAIHPLRVESVAWVAERKDVLSGLFFMLTIAAYVRFARRPGPARYALVSLLFALGLMCKPMLVTLPLVLLLLDYWPLRRGDSRKLSGLVMEKLPLLALSAASSVATLLAQSREIQASGSFSLPWRLGNALMAYMIYLGQMVWPSGLAAFYPYPPAHWPAWEMALAGLLLAGLSWAAWKQRRNQPWLLTGWLWFLVMLLPVVGIVQVALQSHADRYTYLPQIGLYTALTWLAAEWCAQRRTSRAALGSLMAAVLAALGACAWKQTAYWKDSQTLWTHAASCTTDNYVAHFKLGSLFLQSGQLDEAIAHFQSALQFRPDYAQAHNNIGAALLQEGKVDEAILHFQKALQLSPAYGQAENNLASAFLQKGKFDEAIAHLQRALQLEPANPGVLNTLSWLLAAGPDPSLRDGTKAVQLALRANALAGGHNPLILHTLAAAFAQAGQFPQAMETAQRALQLALAQSNTQLAASLQFDLRLYHASRSLPIPAHTLQP